MPLPTDEQVVETGKGLLETLQGISGPHPGFRPAHAKGVLLKGTFIPTPEAGKLSKAQHFNRPSTPIIARFSNSTGLPDLSDASPNAQPNGFALRFQLATHPRREHTDIIGHSVDAFPCSNGNEALVLFRALKDGTIESYLGSHPKALAFVQLPKPFPESFATQRFFSVNAFRLVNAQEKGTYVRYQIVPATGFKTLSEEDVKEKGEGYLFDELPKLLKAGALVFQLMVQVAEDGDVTDDCCEHWPETRKVMELGKISLTVWSRMIPRSRKILFSIPFREAFRGSSPRPTLCWMSGLLCISSVGGSVVPLEMGQQVCGQCVALSRLEYPRILLDVLILDFG